MPNAAAEALKAEGNALFKAGKFAPAIEKYKGATAKDANVPAYWCVRACVLACLRACLLALLLCCCVLLLFCLLLDRSIEQLLRS